MGQINLSDRQPVLIVQIDGTEHILPISFIRELARNGEGLVKPLAVALLERLASGNS